MKKYLVNVILCFMALSMCQCQNENYEDSTSEIDTVEEKTPVELKSNNEIRIPVNFDPKTPLTDKLRKADLSKMIADKYYSFKKPKNRRKHKAVLYRRVDENGIIDLTVGGPLSYEEEWEMIEQHHGHTLRDYFFDAAHYDRWGDYRSELSNTDSAFKRVSKESNLAKVYFIDNFEGFVRYNKSFCDKIIKQLEDKDKNNRNKQIQEHQKLYE